MNQTANIKIFQRFEVLHCGPRALTHITFCFGILWFVELDLMFLSEVGVLSAELCHQISETSQRQCCQTYLSYAFSKFLGSPQSSSLHYALLDFAESSCSWFIMLCSVGTANPTWTNRNWTNTVRRRFMKIKSAVIRENYTFHHTVLFLLFCLYVCCVTVIQCNLTYWLSHMADKA